MNWSKNQLHLRELVLLSIDKGGKAKNYHIKP
jgi:hypothetical protein